MRKKGLDPAALGIEFEGTSTHRQSGKASSLHRLPLKKHEHWWDITDSENEADIPCKENMPGPPRPLNGVDKDKYGLSECLE